MTDYTICMLENKCITYHDHSTFFLFLHAITYMGITCVLFKKN